MSDPLTFQSFSQRLHEALELHLLHGSQHVCCVQSFPFGLHGEVIGTEKNKIQVSHLFVWNSRTKTNKVDLTSPSGSHQEVAYRTKTLAAWEMARRASLDTFTPSGSCERQTVRRSYLLLFLSSHTFTHRAGRAATSCQRAIHLLQNTKLQLSP